MARNLLTDRDVKLAKAGHPPRGSKAQAGKPYRLFDGEGLALFVAVTGVKSWQFRYRLHGLDQTATLGKYPRMSLSGARERADELRKVVEAGEHLTVHKHATRAQKRLETAATFESFATAWVDREARRERWTPKYTDEVRGSLRNHLSELDRLPLVKITAANVAPLMHAVERRAPQMVEKIRRRLRAILDDAVEQGVLTGNPLPAYRRRKSRVERRHYPAVTNLESIGDVLRAGRASDPSKGIQRAHHLLAFTAQRVGEIVPAQWPEFDLEEGLWSIPRERMKRKDTQRGVHVVPLPPGLAKLLREWKDADGDDGMYVCPAPRDPKRHITPEAVEKHYRNALKLAGRHSPHSWRSTFSTICRDAGKDGDVVEAQLDHVVGNKVAAAYDRARRLELRRALMKWYEGKLIAARDGATVHQLAREK